MIEPTDTQIDAAAERGRIARATEPRAAAARYDRQLGRIIVDLTNGCTFTFPPRLAQGLEGATDDQFARIELLGAGYGLHWEDLDVDLSIPGLLAGIFGHPRLHGPTCGTGHLVGQGGGGAGEWRQGWTTPQDRARLIGALLLQYRHGRT